MWFRSRSASMSTVRISSDSSGVSRCFTWRTYEITRGAWQLVAAKARANSADRALGNSRQIASNYSTLAPIRMRLGDVKGFEVRLIECAGSEALGAADDQVDDL